jgi:hypothetical protein
MKLADARTRVMSAMANAPSGLSPAALAEAFVDDDTADGAKDVDLKKYTEAIRAVCLDAWHSGKLVRVMFEDEAKYGLPDNCPGGEKYVDKVHEDLERRLCFIHKQQTVYLRMWVKRRKLDQDEVEKKLGEALRYAIKAARDEFGVSGVLSVLPEPSLEESAAAAIPSAPCVSPPPSA